MKRTAIKFIPKLVIASILLVFSVASQASGFFSHHGNSVNISVGFKHHNSYKHKSYNHKSYRHGYKHNYHQKKYYKPRHYSRKSYRSYNRGFNRGFRSGYSRSYCPSGY